MSIWNTKPRSRIPVGVDKPIRFFVRKPDLEDCRLWCGILLKETPKTYKVYETRVGLSTTSNLALTLPTEVDLIALAERTTSPSQLNKNTLHKVFDSYTAMVEFIKEIQQQYVQYNYKCNPLKEQLRSIARDHREKVGLMFAQEG